MNEAGATLEDCIAMLEYYTGNHGLAAASLPCTRVPVTHLAYPGQLSEIDAIAWRQSPLS